MRELTTMSQRALGGFLHRGPKTVPISTLRNCETVHLGGGELLPCPGIDQLPFADEALARGLGHASLALPPAKVHVLDDARICPGSRVVATNDGRVVAESMTSDMIGSVELLAEEFRAAPLRLDGAVALYRSPWRPLFHTLIDHLPRAALLAQPAIRRMGRITLVHDGPLGDVEERLLIRLIGSNVKLLRVEPGQPVVGDKVLLPGYVTRPFAGAIPSWYRRWLDREVAELRSDAVKRIPGRRYFIDRPLGTRRVLNMASVEGVLQRHNIVPVRPSALSALERILLFRDAEMVIGVTGSGLANLVFSRSTRVIEVSPGAQLLPHFYYLALSKGLPYHHLGGVDDGRGSTAVGRLANDVLVDTVALDELLGSFV